MENKSFYQDKPHSNITNSSADITFMQSSVYILNVVYPPILIIVGVMCNLLIICVMRSKYFRNQSISVLITISSVNDTLSLLISMTTHWLHVAFDSMYDRNSTTIFCKFLNFYGWGNCDYGILLITAMTIDRALAAKYPLKRFVSKSRRRPKCVALFLLFVVLLKEFHLLIWSEMTTIKHRERLCDVIVYDRVYWIFWTQFWPWIHIIFLSICFIIMISSNIVLIFNVYHVLNHGAVRHNFAKHSRIRRFSHPLYGRRRNQNFEAPSISITKGDKQWQSITPMLLGESVMLIILTFPFSIQLAISGYNQDFYHKPDHAMMFSVTFYMLYTNKCVTFFVYLVTGSRFRKELRLLFLTCIRGKKAMRRQKFMKTLLWINAFSQNMASSSTIKRSDRNLRPRLLSASV